MGGPKSYVADELCGRKTFRLKEATQIMCQRGNKSFIDLINQIWVCHIDESSEMMIQSGFIDSEDSDYQNKLYFFCKQCSSFDT